MEAESADLLDRKLMALYGVQAGKPTKMDQAGHESLFTATFDDKPAGMSAEATQAGSKGLSTSNAKLPRDPVSTSTLRSLGVTAGREPSNDPVNAAGGIECYLDAAIPRIDAGDNSTSRKAIGTQASAPHENVRANSGAELPRWDMPIKIVQKCLSHQTSGHDTQLTLRLFKLACLAYKPSNVHYRGMVLDRKTLI